MQSTFYGFAPTVQYRTLKTLQIAFFYEEEKKESRQYYIFSLKCAKFSLRFQEKGNKKKKSRASFKRLKERGENKI
jgi:hypothetical protein